MLGGLEAVEPERLEHADQDDHAGDDRRRAVGMQALTRRRSSRSRAARRASSSLSVDELDAVAVDAARVVGIERLVDRGARGRGAGDRDRARRAAPTASGTERSISAATSAASASSSRSARRVVGEVALALADDAGLHRDAELDRRARRRRSARSSRRRRRSRASARGRRVAVARRAEERQPRLLGPGMARASRP